MNEKTTINTSKEIRWGDWYFRNHVLPDEFDYRVHKKELSPYYLKHGFSVSMMYNDYFSSFNGIESDKYMSVDLYYFYAMPCLNKHDFKNAYSDKNLYPKIFPGKQQPVSIIKCMNGILYTQDNTIVSVEDAVSILLKNGENCIIKPTVDTCNGDGVSSFDNTNREIIANQIKSYGNDFAVQKKLKACKELENLNPTSLNTIRICTYRALDKKVYYVPNSFLRIGGKGSVKDNVSSGGGSLHVSRDGSVGDKIFKYKSINNGSLEQDYGHANFVIPCFEAAISFAIDLHDHLPYFDFVGWDIAILDDYTPAFIEFNILPGVEAMQLTSGVIFGDYIDEVVERIKYVKKSQKVYSINSFRPGFDLHLAAY